MAEQLELKGIAPQSHWKSTKNLSLLKTTRKMETTKDGGKVIGIFLNVDLRNGHFGLAELAKKKDIDINDLKPGNFVFFFNTKKDTMKLYCASNFIAYHRSPHGKIDMSIVREIPKIFGADGTMNLEAAVDKALDNMLTKRLKKSVAEA